jgi:anti-anti-sigma factor
MVTYRVEHEHVIFSVGEDLTLDNIAHFVEVFEQAIEETRIYQVIIEAQNIPMADSSGIGALVSQYKRLRDKGGSIVLVGAREGLLETLRVTALDKILMPRTDLEKALEQD